PCRDPLSAPLRVGHSQDARGHALGHRARVRGRIRVSRRHRGPRRYGPGGAPGLDRPALRPRDALDARARDARAGRRADNGGLPPAPAPCGRPAAPPPPPSPPPPPTHPPSPPPPP